MLTLLPPTGYYETYWCLQMARSTRITHPLYRLFFSLRTTSPKCHSIMSTYFQVSSMPGRKFMSETSRIIFSKISISPPTVSSVDQNVTLPRNKIHGCIFKQTLHTHTYTHTHTASSRSSGSSRSGWTRLLRMCGDVWYQLLGAEWCVPANRVSVSWIEVTLSPNKHADKLHVNTSVLLWGLRPGSFTQQDKMRFDSNIQVGFLRASV